MTTDSSFIVAERPNGRATTKSAYRCHGKADFIGRITQLAIRSGEQFDTVDACLEYLDDRYAQCTTIITRQKFDADGPDAFDQAVLDQAEALGWYTPPEDEEV